MSPPKGFGPKERRLPRSLLIGFDPGKETGCAVFEGTEMISSYVIDGGFEGFMEWATSHNGNWLLHHAEGLVVERYIPLEGFRGLDQTHSLEVQGAIRTLATQLATPVVLQPRSHKALLFGQNGELGDAGEAARVGWLAERGFGFKAKHDMDAATHVLVERKLARDKEFWRRYWVQ